MRAGRSEQLAAVGNAAIAVGIEAQIALPAASSGICSTLPSASRSKEKRLSDRAAALPAKLTTNGSLNSTRPCSTDSRGAGEITAHRQRHVEGDRPAVGGAHFAAGAHRRALVLFQMFAGPRLPFDDTAPAGRVLAVPPASRIRRGILARRTARIAATRSCSRRRTSSASRFSGGTSRAASAARMASRKLTAVSLSHSCRRA